MRHKSYNSNTAFLDLLFNSLLGFVALFVIALILIKEEKKKENIQKKAEFIMTAKWPENLDHDIDMYLEDPEGNIVFFNARERGLMHLERDDLGLTNDLMVTESGEVIYGENSEVITIRGVAAGEYVLNLHLYNKNSNVNNDTSVEVEVIKLNKYEKVLKKTYVFKNVGQEITACRFTLNADGDVVDISYLTKQMVPDSYVEGSGQVQYPRYGEGSIGDETGE
jgi:hypothetical protein